MRKNINIDELIKEAKENLKKGSVCYEFTTPFIKPLPKCDAPIFITNIDSGEVEKEPKVNISDLIQATEQARGYLKDGLYKTVEIMFDFLLNELNKIKEDYEKSKSEKGSGN